MRIFYPLLFLSGLFLLGGCSQKDEVAEFNKPALHWYKQMIGEVRSNNLEKADDYFSSLQSEHVSSPLLPEAMLILAKAHMDNEEYLLARFYVDEYIKRFGSKENIDYAKQLKIQAGFRSFKLTGRDQDQLQKSIQEAEDYIRENPYSPSRPLVDTMLVKMHLANMHLNYEIAALYDRLDKPEAAERYRNREEYDWVKNMLVTQPESEWYREIFNW